MNDYIQPRVEAVEDIRIEGEVIPKGSIGHLCKHSPKVNGRPLEIGDGSVVVKFDYHKRLVCRKAEIKLIP
jgi:hypothetical protein